MKSNHGVIGFNQNTYQAQAFKDQSKETFADNNMMLTNLLDSPIEIAMPFVCEECIVSWEIQAYPIEMGTLSNDLENEQFHAVLVILMQKLRNKRLKVRGFCVIAAVTVPPVLPSVL